ncbi:MAG: type II CRISPR RNA-guided endonuclease Cas9 [Salinivirgaceae bacterium]|nr:type II CRISPR RNA-guided endonuclease Cas9 [Salinivirgaceae bacterium]
MSKILGLDLGTNSIGWAVVETADNKTFELLDKGVRIFQEGVKIEKGIEGSKAAERTGFRSARRLKFRRKLRKIETLKTLIKYDFCPQLSANELLNWRNKKIYPEQREFREWWLTNEHKKVNPYFFRALAVEQKFDLNNREDRYKLGRAFYHMAQRRGFLSNRLESTKESDGTVKKAIADINEAKGEKTLGQYFYEKYCNGEKIRNQYTHRDEHYLQEFKEICQVQNLPTEFVGQLQKAIFYQRPLKSQKGLVGKCPFEPNKPRCAVSHPAFEEYRMLCFVNNIKIKTPDDEKLRILNNDEKLKIKALFFRKSKEHFDFEDIAKQLAPKKQYKYYKDREKNPEDYLLNYHMKTTVSGCPVSARFASLFGDDWKDLKIKYIREKDGKTSSIDINDVWHVLFTFDSDEKLTEFAQNRLKLDKDNIKEFLKIHLKQDYGSLSLKAINKILPFLREGLIYSHAVFLANMEAAIPQDIWANNENKKIIRDEIHEIIKNQNEEKQVLEVVNGMIKTCRTNNWVWSNEAESDFHNDLEAKIKASYGENRWQQFETAKKDRISQNAKNLFKINMQKKMGQGDFAKVQRIDERVKTFISDHFAISNGSLEKIYHPSAIDVYKEPIKGDDGKLYLGSPMVASVRNPMAMRALHQLRKLINELIRQDSIDETTKVNIEMARDLKNSNERKALQSWQRDRETLRKEYAERIKEYFTKDGRNLEPTDEDLLKYQLWEEQERMCLYTGEPINVSDFLGADPKFDIEHTIPRSQSFDNSQENKTLCSSRFNREVKRNKIPTQLANHLDILSRIEKWKEKLEELNVKIQKLKKVSPTDKDAKDRLIQNRHKLSIEHNYWKNKYQRFTMYDVPEGFKNSQLVDIGIITKYSRMYLNTLFNKVYTVKGSTVADFRKLWGLQDADINKARINHIHHCVDAITIACISKQNYENLAKFYHDWEELHHAGVNSKPQVNKPWETFSQDVKAIENEVLISHHTPDNLPKQSKKKLRKRGKIQLNKKGEPIYQQGDTVRGSLHKETFYGAIKKEITNKNGEKEEKVLYVVRKSIENIKKSEVDKIVDEVIKEKVKQAIKEKTLEITSSDTSANKLNSTIWMNEEKNVCIKKVRIYQTSVTNPLNIKKHRDINLKNPKEHKEYIHVTNDGNYLMAIYEGKDAKGKIKRDFEIVNNLKAGEYFKHSVQRVLNPQGFKNLEGLVPDVKESGKLQLPLKCVIKTGTMVILWENSPDEIWDLEQADIKKRLYKVTGLSEQIIQSKYHFATIVMRFHQEASPESDLKVQDGAFEKDENYKAQRKMNHNQFNALVQGYDFNLNILGQIEKV